jgi:hypothetical protein
MSRATITALATVLLSACSSAQLVGPPPATAGTEPAPAADLSALPAHCTARGSSPQVLPDPACTPGATDPRVTQANLAATICRSGYTATVRPPTSYTEPLKRELMRRYGDAGAMSGYELDHLISLELGGSPASPSNLWPEPGASPNAKDRVEQAANRAVCTGRMPLADVQHRIAANWVELGHELGVA